MTEPIKTRYTWLIEYETPSDAPAAHAHMQALGGEVVAVQFSDALGELSRAEAEVERLRSVLTAIVDFVDGPAEAKRPDVFALRMKAVRAALKEKQT
jgi:hypothetical protein